MLLRTHTFTSTVSIKGKTETGREMLIVELLLENWLDSKRNQGILLRRVPTAFPSSLRLSLSPQNPASRLHFLPSFSPKVGKSIRKDGKLSLRSLSLILSLTTMHSLLLFLSLSPYSFIFLLFSRTCLLTFPVILWKSNSVSIFWLRHKLPGKLTL